MRSPRDILRAFVGCHAWGWKIVLACVSALFAGGILRVVLMVAATAVSDPAAAIVGNQLVQDAVALSVIDFGMATGMGTVGGFASLMAELRRDWSRFALMSGVGHMVVAQFASLLVYLLCVSQKIDLPLALAASGICGWLGNVGIEALARVVGRMIGLTLPGGEPPKDSAP